MDAKTVGTIVNGKYVGAKSTPAQQAAFAEMLQLRQAPRAMTDRELFHDVGTLDKQFGGHEGALNAVIGEAKKHGYTPNYNDFYNSAIAAFPGDPKAFIPATGGRGHIQKVCEERDWSCHGAVEVNGSAASHEPTSVALADDLVKEGVRDAIKKDPSLARKPLRELKEMAIENHGAKKGRHL